MNDELHPEVRGEEARCDCGHLVAKLRKTGVELKCKRCKRIVVIPFDAMGETMSQPSSVNL